MTLIDKIKNWWEGKYIPPPEDNGRDGVWFFVIGHYERPALRRALEASLSWLSRHGSEILVGCVTGLIGFICFSAWNALFG